MLALSGIPAATSAQLARFPELEEPLEIVDASGDTVTFVVPEPLEYRIVGGYVFEASTGVREPMSGDLTLSPGFLFLALDSGAPLLPTDTYRVPNFSIQAGRRHLGIDFIGEVPPVTRVAFPQHIAEGSRSDAHPRREPRRPPRPPDSLPSARYRRGPGRHPAVRTGREGERWTGRGLHRLRAAPLGVCSVERSSAGETP